MAVSGWVLWLLGMCVSGLVTGYLSLLLSGISYRLRSVDNVPSLAECMPSPVLGKATAGAVLLTCVIASKTGFPPGVPWEVLVLIVVLAPLFLDWLGPPQEHLRDSQHRHVGTYNAWNHYYGYLQLFRKENQVRRRLRSYAQKHSPRNSVEQSGGQATMSEQSGGQQPMSCAPGSMQVSSRSLESEGSSVVLEGCLNWKVVVVLWPVDGFYPDRFEDLDGVTSECDVVPGFTQEVAGNTRTYGKFKVHKVNSSDCKETHLVALDKVSALETLRKMSEHDPAGLCRMDCRQQMNEMLATMRYIIENRRHLKGQLLLVTYTPGEHVGDRIINALRWI